MSPFLQACGAAVVGAAALVGALAGETRAPAAPSAAASKPATPDDGAVPRYQHVFVIVEENKDYGQVLDPALAPNLAKLAASYGDAADFYGEVHPSEANYVALLGGDTFGIHDDDGFYCRPRKIDVACLGAVLPGYVNHTVRAHHLGDQLASAGLTWKGYYESLPTPGSLALNASDPALDHGVKLPYYASKHSGFLNFYDVQHDAKRAAHIVTFHELDADLASGDLPNFALIIPNQCNEMHGLDGIDAPDGCDGHDSPGLIRRGDTVAGDLVSRIQATDAWRSADNVAIVITFDEGSGHTVEGCCGADVGGGHIPTIVITNHGPHGLKDVTPYNHYSLLRTIEDAFGISDHLRHAADSAKGVVAMAPLFQTTTTEAAK